MAQAHGQIGHVISVDGTTIAYARCGEGAPVILVGGALNDRASGRVLTTLLQPDFCVVTYDRRGRGESGDQAEYDFRREIEDLDALIQMVGGSAFVYGMSSGAILALQGAIDGLAINSLALYEPPLQLKEEQVKRIVPLISELDNLVSADRRGDAVELFLTKATGAPDDMVAQLRQASVWPRLESLAHTLSYDVAIAAGFAPALMRTIPTDIPTLVMGGDLSPPPLKKAVQAFANIAPHIRIMIMEDQDHNVDPAVLAPVLVDFFGR